MTPSDFGTIGDAARLAGMLPYLQRTIEGMVKRLEGRVFAGLQAGTLTPEAALFAWLERKAYKDLLKSFKTQIKIGQSIGERSAQDLSLDSEPTSGPYLIRPPT